ncbi:molybdopterin molybdotransferase MoeA [Pseudohoeflea suaedae]|uniref:Molybdopterin molybdenumtransferase n=1 Tax=Pseudohoeflea suaedae TaxID=877384 RepID=A0A4V3A747_9HYPH|nr:gephyrin-like molybdotransferase Glp [Pseudohoeflea suaedae]TDH36192.1 molybdopterin molybdotransferase MoeA [Pseudohoeflea suaedae]
MALMPVDEALSRVTGDAKPVTRTETLTLGEAAGRVLARDLVALRTQPPFSASAMDGYAVRSADVTEPGAELELIGESAAGHGFEGTLRTGQTVRIFTGAPLPDGADSIVIQEDTETLEGGRVRMGVSAAEGKHVRLAGVDFTKGRAGLAAGRFLDPGAITLAAAMNHPRVEVHARPKVAILATGDELKLPGEELGPGQIIASNTYGIAAMVRAAGGEVIDLGIARDDMQALDAALDSALTQGADVLVTVGGASVGDHDLVQDALRNRGMSLDFWKIAMRPGKPLMSGRLGDMKVLGLPGNPASSLVCGYLFLEPLVALLAGRAVPRRLRKAFLGNALPENGERQDYMRGRLSLNAEGQMIASSFQLQDSSLMSVFADADCLIVRPPFAPAAHTGDETDVLVLSA